MDFSNTTPALDRAIWLEMGKVAVSTDGQTNVWSPGFCNCMGVIVGNAEGRGGIAAHILGGGSKPGLHRSFLREATFTFIAMARQRWPSVTAVLTHGDSCGGEYPELVHEIGARFNEVAVMDLRIPEHRVKGGQFFYDSAAQRVYIWEASVTIEDHMYEGMDANSRAGQIETVEIYHAMKGMRCFTCP